MSHPLLLKIKEQTKEKHISLEQQPLLHSLTASDLDHAQYLKILVKFYGFFSPLEKKINDFQLIHHFLPDFARRRKASALLADIDIVSKKENSAPVLYECEDLPQVSNTAEAFGSLYVMEGSTLGGRFIYKNLEKNLRLDKQDGALFFYGYGDETGSKWKEFQAGLSRFSEENPEENASTIMAAEETFEKLKSWFDS